MANSRIQSTDYVDKLPIEYSLREALSIYFKRLKIFFIVVIVNLLVFLFFITAQRLSIRFVYLLHMNMVAFAFFLIIILLIPTFSFVYLKSNPVKGYLVFLDETERISTINLYSGWRSTKKKFFLSGRYFQHTTFLLVARNIRYHERKVLDEPSRSHIYIQLQDESRRILFQGKIADGESIYLKRGIYITYQTKGILKGNTG